MTNKSDEIWDVSKFEDFFDVPIRNGLFRPTSVRGKGIKMINMGEIFAHGRIGDIDMQLVPLDDTDYEKYLVKKNDLLFARSSLAAGAGKCCIFVGKEPTTFESHVIRARINPTLGDSRFYYYYFNSYAGKQLIETIVEKTAASGIRSSDLSKLIVPHPPINVQTKIADLCEKLDQQIEVNQHLNKTLATIGQKVFKHWFIDFEFPNEEGKPYKSSGGNMVYNKELGTEIPKGWYVDNLGNLCTEITDGSHFSPKMDVKGTKRIATVKNMGLFDIDFESCKTISDSDYDKLVRDGCRPEKGDILLSKDGTMGITHVFNGQDNLVLLSSIAILRANEKLSYHYLYHYLKENRTQTRLIENHSSGSALPRIVLRDLKKLPVLVPVREYLDIFGLFTKPIIESILHNSNKSKILSKIRDSLFPKLMSGKIRVPVEA